MKVEVKQLSRLAKRLVDEGFVLKGTVYEVDPEAYLESFKHWTALVTEAQAHEEAVVYALTHPSHAHIKRESDCCDDDAAEFRVLAKWMKIVALLLGLLILATLAAPHLHAQGKDSQVFTIKFKEAGTAKGTMAGPFSMDFTSGCTVTKSGSTISVSCPGGSAPTAGAGINVTGSTISATNKCVQTSIQAGDTISGVQTAPNYFATNCLIAANTLAVGNVLEFWISGVWTTDATAGGRFEKQGVKACTVSGCATGTATTILPVAGLFAAQNLTNLGFHYDGRCIVISTGASGTLECQGWNVNADSSGQGSSNTWLAPNTATITIDTTVDQYLTVFNGSNQTGAGDVTRMRQYIVGLKK
jgi:hypothetical protein